MTGESMPGVAFDVASRRQWAGQAARDDIRWWTEIRPPELPWPLRFYFVWAAEHEESEPYLECVGLTIGESIPQGDAHVEGDPDDIALTATAFLAISDKFTYYRRMAEALLIPSDESEQRAREIRSGMGKRRGSRLQDAELAVLVSEWRDRDGQPGRMQEMADAHGINRHTLRRRLEEAEKRGFISEGLPNRPRRHAQQPV